MRISDWSSDVCSSDLSASCRICLHDEHYSGSSPVITVTGAPVLPLCKLSAVTISVLPGLRIVKRFWRNSSGSVSRSRSCRDTSPARVLPRSEEHTSELQSLMRISYDVLCLKKKHTTRTDPQSNQS